MKILWVVRSSADTCPELGKSGLTGRRYRTPLTFSQKPMDIQTYWYGIMLAV